ncbi:MAG: alcohol dehydrogenase catalytic domain-containing protein [Opitutaceae bacterium]|nr:alcohol dehydrogenase catalytic domain-containing protein [Opitutaceae bacterium]
MKALLLTAPSQLAYVDLPDPEPAADEVLLRVRACGICGSDLHGWDGASGRRRPPLIMGHEAVAEIAAVGPAVRGWTAGERVTFDSTVWCGTCARCRAGDINLCLHRRVVGVSPGEYRQHGAFAELLALPARILHRVPGGLTDAQAVFVEPTSIAVHAVRRAAVADDTAAVVVGAGMIGLLVIQALRWAGARQVIAIDLAADRLELALRLGATQALRADAADVPGEVARLTGGQGADVCLEAVGIGPTVNLALATLRAGGRAVLVGNLAPVTADFPLQRVVTRELTITGTCGSAGEYPLCLDLLGRGVIRTEPLVSAVAPLREGAEWFQRLSRPGGGQLKVILVP